MSAIPSGGVSIPFQSDLTQARQQWQAFLQEVQQTAATIPATFGNLQGVQVPRSYDYNPTAGGFQFAGRSIAAGGRGPDAAQRMAAVEDRQLRAEERIAATTEAQAAQAEADAREAAAPAGGDGGGFGGGGRGGGYGGRRMGGFGRILMPYFLAREALHVGEGYFDYRDSVALARTDDEKIDAGIKFQKELESIPIGGQLGALALSVTGRKRDMDLALRQRDDAKKDYAAEQEDFRERQRSRLTVESLQDRADAESLPTQFGRQKAAIQNEYESWRSQQRNRIDQLNRETDEPNVSSVDRARRVQAYNTAVADFNREDPAQIALAFSKLASLVRGVSERTRDLAFAEPGLHARLEGQVGIAGERDFEAGLQRQETAADRFNLVYGREVRRQNQERRVIRQDEIDEGIQERFASTSVVADRLHRNSAEAQRDALEEQRRVALRGARSRRDADSINNHFDRQLRLDEQDRGDENFGVVSDIRSRNLSLAIRARTTGNPALNDEQAHATDLLTGTLRQAERAFTAGRGAVVPDIYQGGRLELEAYRQQLKTGFKADEVDLNRTAFGGASTENPADVFKAIDDALKKLEAIPTSLDQIRDLLRGILKAA